jgi:monofunctional biosynthetic peptidoglycan transglycosylase
MKLFFNRLKKWLFRVSLIFLGSSFFFVILYRFMPVYITPLMIIRAFEQLTDNDPMQFKKQWVPINQISKYFPLAVIAAEDQLFFEHNGFDFKAIEKAIDYNQKTKGKKIKGASTISQQTAKNVFLWPGRSWLRKGLEVYFTFLIELFWSKNRIMEVYLNVIEMGRGIYGAQAAAQYFYNCNAIQLSAQQCAAIAAILPNPIKWNPIKPTRYVARKQQWILKQMNQLSQKQIFND